MSAVYIVAVVIAAVIISIAVLYALDNMNKRSKNCSNLTKSAPMQNITKEDARYTTPLRDFHVKSSYNSCASGQYKNDWVDICALSHVIKEGCRLLDFEIYDVKGVPIVAVSDSPKYTLKHSYNSIPLSRVLKCIEDEAFSGDVNGMDPLFLNFRIKSDHVELMDAIAKMLPQYATLSSRLLAPKYGYEFQGRNFGKIPLRLLCQKVIIMTNDNKQIDESKLSEFVNLAPSPLFRVLPFTGLASQDLEELTTFSQTRLMMIVPSTADNYTSASTVTLGAQFSAMNFQTKDKNLEAYNAEFLKNGNYAFYLKKTPYVEAEIPDAKTLPESTTFGETRYQNDYFDYTI
jgi:hypothetical protein